jgi:hypothetical protein
MVWQFLFFSYDNWVSSSTIISRTVNLDNVGEKKDLMLYEVIIIIITTMSYMPITQPFVILHAIFTMY